MLKFDWLQPKRNLSVLAEESFDPRIGIETPVFDEDQQVLEWLFLSPPIRDYHQVSPTTHLF